MEKKIEPQGAKKVTEKADKTTTEAPQKRERIPFGESRLGLTAVLKDSIKDQYHCRWINDTKDRLHRAQEGGYDFVLENELAGRVGEGDLHGANTDLNGKVSKVVTTKGESGPVRGYLMKLPMRFKQEDVERKAAKYNRVDEAIRATGDPGGTSAEKHQYGEVNLSRR